LSNPALTILAASAPHRRVRRTVCQPKAGEEGGTSGRAGLVPRNNSDDRTGLAIALHGVVYRLAPF